MAWVADSTRLGGVGSLSKAQWIRLPSTNKLLVLFYKRDLLIINLSLIDVKYDLHES